MITIYCFDCHNVCPCDKSDTGFGKCLICGKEGVICYRCTCAERELENSQDAKTKTESEKEKVEVG